jgi:hypothetical protein
MPQAVAVPTAGLMGLSDRDYEKRPAVRLECPPNDRLPVAKPCPMDERTPAPTAVLPLAVNDLSAARTQLPTGGKPWRPDLSDQFFRAPEGRPLLVRIGRDNPPLPLGPLSGSSGKSRS